METRFGVKNKFVVSYIGAIGFANGLDTFLKCAYESQQAFLPIHFLLCGEGGFLSHIKRLCAHYQLDNFSFIPFQTREGVREIMNVTDATFISYKPVPILETGSPNKYFDGLAAGKLIIVNFGGWIKEEIEREKCGIYVNPEYPADFVKRIIPFLENPEVLHQHQHAGRLLAEKKYSRTILSEQFASIIMQSVLAGKTIKENKY